MGPQTPFNRPLQPPAVRADSLRALVRNTLRQTQATSDTLLVLADALSEIENSPEARHLASALRDLAPAYATAGPLVSAAAVDPARALIRKHPVRAARLRKLFAGLPEPMTAQELAMLTDLARAADLEEGHSP